MTTEQTTLHDDLASRLNRRPFQPFVVQMINGEKHMIVRVAQMGIGMTVGTIASAAGDSSVQIKLADISLVRDI